MASVELRLRPAAADEVEAWLPRLAAEYAVGLNVHGQYAVARGLYYSLGYQVTAQQMKKVL